VFGDGVVEIGLGQDEHILLINIVVGFDRRENAGQGQENKQSTLHSSNLFIHSLKTRLRSDPSAVKMGKISTDPRGSAATQWKSKGVDREKVPSETDLRLNASLMTTASLGNAGC
jgi:hypothetical protein